MATSRQHASIPKQGLCLFLLLPDHVDREPTSTADLVAGAPPSCIMDRIVNLLALYLHYNATRASF